MPGAQSSTPAPQVALGPSRPAHEAAVQFCVPLSSKPPYGAAQPWSLSSTGKTRWGPILYPPPQCRGVLLQLPFLHAEGGRNRGFTLLRAHRNHIPLKSGP